MSVLKTYRLKNKKTGETLSLHQRVIHIGEDAVYAVGSGLIDRDDIEVECYNSLLLRTVSYKDFVGENSEQN